MKLNKKKFICIILIACFCINMLCIKIVKANDAEIINFKDDNLKNALIEIGVDTDGDGNISKDEASNVTRLNVMNKEIRNISDIKNFINLKEIFIENNYIEDISCFESLKSLEYIGVAGNKIDYSPLRKFDKDTIETVNRLKSNGVRLYGLHEQRVDYSEEKISNQPEYKVLFVYVNSIDANIEKDGEEVNYKKTLTSKEILYFEECRKMFEKCTEKLSDYTVNIVTDKYITKNVISEMNIGYDNGNKVYCIKAENIPEIRNYLNLYDTIFICAMYNDDYVPHTMSGQAFTDFPSPESSSNPYGNAMVYFHPEDVQEIDTLKNEIITQNISTMIHEFIHTVEGYGLYMGFDIWEWHDAIRYYESCNYGSGITDVLPAHYYMIGTPNPNNNGTSGIPEHIWKIPPSKITNKSIVINKAELDLKQGENEILYCSLRNDNYDGSTINVWQKDVTWVSENPEIASVDENGMVLAKKSGTCEIIAENKELGKSIKCKVNVSGDNGQKEIESISIKTNPNRLNYFKGDTLDLYGLTINVNYSDGTSEEKVSGCTCDKNTLNETGKQTITITYDGKNTTLNVNVYNIEEVAKDWTDMSNLKYRIIDTGSNEKPEYNLNIYNFEKKKGHNYYIWIAPSGDGFIEENIAINGLLTNQVNSVSFIKFENLSANIDYWMNKSNELSFQIIDEYEVAKGLIALKVVYGKTKLDKTNKSDVKVEYKILEGAEQKLDDKSDLIVKADGDIKKFVGLNIDGKELNKDNYTVKSGSTIVTIKKEYLANLKEGEHSLTFVYEDGKVSTTFEVKKQTSDETQAKTSLPQTGDKIGMVLIIAIISAGIFVLTIKHKKNKF